MVDGVMNASAEKEPGRARPGISAFIRLWLGGWPLAQIALYLGTLLLFVWLGRNLVANMARLGLTPGFEFLEHAANYEIGESFIAYAAGDSYARAALAGLLNTIVVSALGCLVATVLGVALGIARLSVNPLVSRLVQAYVEVLRNTPLLLQLFAWNTVIHLLPVPRQALSPLPGVLLTNRGLFLPAVDAGGHGAIVAAAIVAAIVATWLVLKRRRRLAGPAPRRVVVLAYAAAVLLPVGIAAGFGVAFAPDIPTLGGFNIRGGVSMTPEFAALMLGLAVNASASIAETVRAGILAVPGGQWEAARALGLRPFAVLRLVVLPQALRIIIPVMTSSYLSLTKNSSLAVAIGFPDLVSILNTTANVTGQALEVIALMLGAYLTLSLATSAVMNVYNRRSVLRGERR
ncbi:amino-acid transporter subunit; membrane component of ABC superfamily [uncultured Pleomorphomonas sp.]|uniref:Amino-acid transporter subunit membrane component of ABC superfamily n=1 Tax=uncultured Pleomorphomonas sp. TaxID=442121 RepID=A0A212LH67_9HYPH|nr:ABC transporter permease subunit [uncultured Pleomorphomonas sp.]SCM76913.1 amino-acid transporter subunit; membrane component of ABC superfamily [uncultured Pleomorphomonas sp.]